MRPSGADTALLELHHGPTLAFKDVAARTMGRWLAHSLRRRGERPRCWWPPRATPAAPWPTASPGSPGLRVVVLYPAGRVSPVQERQLTPRARASRARRGRATSTPASGSQGQALVDPALADLDLTSANSINVGRLLPQATYHVWGVLQFARLGVSTS
jgi:threonine synthase